MNNQQDGLQPKISTLVLYRPSWRRPPQKAWIEWTKDDMVRILANSPEGVKEAVVNVPVARIQKFSVFQGTAKVTIDNEVYQLTDQTWDTGFGLGGAMGGLVGLLIAARAENKSGLRQWIDPLKEKNISVHYQGAFWILKISLLLAALLIAGISLYLYMK